MLSGHILRNRYKIIKLLGSGSFGITYLAEDLDLPEHPLCVVKNLRQSQNQQELEDFIAFFNKEAKALYRLGNELNQIPRLFAHFEEGGEFYLVQEYIDGHDLSQEIFSGNQLSEDKVVELLQEILEVLTPIHNKNIIHRDIKAQNLMRRKSDGKIILIDFGTVKEISQLKVNPQEPTNVSVIVGTYGYMPSEQLNGYPKLSSDVYAVGMLGIYALTGIRPQDLPKDPDTFEVIWQDKVSVSPKLAKVLDKMVRSKFKERYQTAGEALQALITSLISRRNLLGVSQKIVVGVGAAVSILFGIGLLLMTFSESSVTEVEQNSDTKLACSETYLQSALARNPDINRQGNRYYGTLKNGKYHGCGILIFAKSGNKYRGRFQEGEFHGQGTFLFKNGEKYTGQFRNSLYEGIGKFVYKNGCQYIGEFKNSRFHGQGTCISQDGYRQTNTWNKGNLVGQDKTCCN